MRDMGYGIWDEGYGLRVIFACKPMYQQPIAHSYIYRSENLPATGWLISLEFSHKGSFSLRGEKYMGRTVVTCIKI